MSQQLPQWESQESYFKTKQAWPLPHDTHQLPPDLYDKVMERVNALQVSMEELKEIIRKVVQEELRRIFRHMGGTYLETSTVLFNNKGK